MSNSSTITKALDPARPVHPGEMLREELLPDLHLTVGDLASASGIDEEHLAAVIREDAPITGEDSVRLGRVFSMTEGFWIRLQNLYDVEQAKRSFAAEIARLPILAAE